MCHAHSGRVHLEEEAEGCFGEDLRQRTETVVHRKGGRKVVASTGGKKEGKRKSQQTNKHKQMAEAKADQQSAMCSVCMETYVAEGERVPMLLGCGHTFCAVCLASCVHDGNEVRCPVCQAPTQLGPGGIGSLKKNFALADVLAARCLSGSHPPASHSSPVRFLFVF